jgi:DNA-directed RNA polymerase specialized sigma24 family protein
MWSNSWPGLGWDGVYRRLVAFWLGYRAHAVAQANAEDSTQGGLVRLLKQKRHQPVPDFKSRKHFEYSWAQAAEHTAIDQMRREGRAPVPLPGNIDAPAPDTDADADADADAEFAEPFALCWSTLSAQEREVLLLHVQGLSFEEIGRHVIPPAPTTPAAEPARSGWFMRQARQLYQQAYYRLIGCLRQKGFNLPDLP